ncbi:MAG: hypothetical protein H6737_15660 [Alphaproteobacteria bacterium]|nr:hypothetical protein [Alphaproteobacteria bacterium]
MIVPTAAEVAPFLAVLLGALVLPAVLDVLRRPARVPLYWGMPLAVGAAGLVGLAFVAPLREVAPGLARTLYRANLLAMVAGTTSAATLVELGLLCGARALRPDGALGPPRWPWVGGAGVAVASVGLAGLAMPPLLWALPFAGVALVACLTVARGGSARVEQGAAVGRDGWLLAVSTGGVAALAVPVAAGGWGEAALAGALVAVGIAFAGAFAAPWTWRSALVLALLPVGVLAPWV